MTTTTSPRRWRTRVGILAAGAAMALAPSMASAETIVPIEYDAVGTTTIAKTGGSIALGPTTLRTNLDVDSGNFTGSLPIPQTRTEFKAAGFLPVSADVRFVETRPLRGQIDLAGDIASVTSTATYSVQLRNVKVLGFPTFAGPRCQTKAPVSIPVATEPGVGFDLTEGGRLVGTYTIGEFQNCGLNTFLINALVSGPNNKVQIDVSNGRFL